MNGQLNLDQKEIEQALREWAESKGHTVNRNKPIHGAGGISLHHDPGCPNDPRDQPRFYAHIHLESIPTTGENDGA